MSYSVVIQTSLGTQSFDLHEKRGGGGHFVLSIELMCPNSNPNQTVSFSVRDHAFNIFYQERPRRILDSK